MAPAVSCATCSASHSTWARTFTGFLWARWRLSMGTCRLVHQIAKERASTQTSPNLIEKADFSVVQLHFDGSNTCCVVHSVAPWCCGFTRRGLLVLLMRKRDYDELDVDSGVNGSSKTSGRAKRRNIRRARGMPVSSHCETAPGVISHNSAVFVVPPRRSIRVLVSICLL